MADKTIRELPGISSLDAGSLFVAEQSGQAVKVSGKQLTDFSNVETTAQVEQAKASAQEAKTAQAAAEAAILRGPVIQNGTWWVYNQTAGAYQDTGIKATGPQGIPGPTSSVNDVTPDSNGNITLTSADVKMPDGTTTIKEAFDGMVHDVSQLVNPNLLDNWYFGNPVNQRGQTSYSVNGYTIDRWYTANSYSYGTLIVDKTAGCITISHNDDGGFVDFIQTLENPTTEIVTLSVLMLSGNLYSATGTLGSFLLNADEIFIRSDEPNKVVLRCKTGKTISMIAAKLELGSQQTLAHKDTNGNWVLNEIPNYAEELAKCQNCYRTFNAWTKFAADYIDANRIMFSIPGKMRANPVVGGNFKLYVGQTEQSGFAFTAYDNGNNTVIVATKNNHGLTSAWLGVSADFGTLDANL